MRLTNTGLGIGTSSPTSRVTVGSGTFNAAASGTTGLYTAASGANAGYLTVITDGIDVSTRAGAGRLILDAPGNLGLGVTPSAWNSAYKALDIGNSFGIIGGSLSADLYYNAFLNSGGSFIYKATTSASAYSLAGGQHRWYTAPSGTAGDAISFTQAMTLTAQGNELFVGTTSGFSSTTNRANFSLNGQTDAIMSVGVAGVRKAGIYASATASTLINDNATQVFETGGSERARIDSSGRLLVGTTSNIFDSGRGGVTGVSVLGGQAVYYFFNSSGSTDTDASPVLGCYKESATTSSSARFVQFYASGQGTPMGGIVGNGASNVQFASISDAREKTNIAPISGSLEKVVALRPVEFDWIANGEHCPAGFVAQDVEQVFPEFVVENMANDGEETRKGLTGGMTGGIVAHLVKAIQEQQALIQTLTARVAALESN
jgi:hypothetical protein